MGEISNQQIYDLVLEISNGVAELDTSIDGLLFDAKAFNQELAICRQQLIHQAYPT